MLLTSRSCIYSQVLVHSTVVNSRNGLRYICISAFLTHSDKFSHLSSLMPHSDPCPRNTHSYTGKPDSKVLNLFESVHNYGRVWRTDTSGLLFSVRFLFLHIFPAVLCGTHRISAMLLLSKDAGSSSYLLHSDLQS